MKNFPTEESEKPEGVASSPKRPARVHKIVADELAPTPEAVLPDMRTETEATSSTMVADIGSLLGKLSASNSSDIESSE